eukprot:8996251-Pyramimonas_sp.AAC.1
MCTEVLHDWSHRGYQPVVAPSYQLKLTAKAGGISMGVRKRCQFQSFRHLATDRRMQMGLRQVQD